MIYLREFIAGVISPCVVLSKRRFSQQLFRFAHTELYTSFDINSVAQRQSGEVRLEMERHAQDELRHYRIFKEWAARLQPYVGANYGDPEDIAGLNHNAVRDSARLPAAPNLRLPELGDYMLYIFLSESRAVIQFKLYQWINFYDRGCTHTIPAVLVDEKRHVAYSLKHAWREFRRAPAARGRGALRVAWYILKQDLIDLGKLIQTLGSGIMGHVLYYGILTPYALVLRLFGSTRRASLRKHVARESVALDASYWREL